MPCPLPLSGHCSQDQEETGQEPVGWRQASQTKGVTGVAAVFTAVEEAGQAWGSVWGRILE